jgi:hypothetical protein
MRIAKELSDLIVYCRPVPFKIENGEFKYRLFNCRALVLIYMMLIIMLVNYGVKYVKLCC